jgi:hypothetical protein
MHVGRRKHGLNFQNIGYLLASGCVSHAAHAEELEFSLMLKELTVIHVFLFNWFVIAGMALFEAVGVEKTDTVFQQYEMASRSSLGVLLGVEFLWIFGFISNHALGNLEATAFLVGNAIVWGIALLRTLQRRIYYLLATGALLAAVLWVPLKAGLAAVVVGVCTVLAPAIKFFLLRLVRS